MNRLHIPDPPGTCDLQGSKSAATAHSHQASPKPSTTMDVWYVLVLDGACKAAAVVDLKAEDRAAHLVARIKSSQELRAAVSDILVYENEASYTNNEAPIQTTALVKATAAEEPGSFYYVVVKEAKSLLRDGLPEMTMSGSRTDGSASKNHDPATCIVTPFGLVDQQWKNVTSSLYAGMDNQHVTKLKYASESDIQGHTKNLLYDIIGMTEIDSITCLNEPSIFGHRVDIWLIARGGKPIGVVEIKKPGSDILYNEYVLGQLYNYMLRLQSFFGVTNVFGIVTTYQEWRICWLSEANESAATGTPLQNLSKPSGGFQAPLPNNNQRKSGRSSSQRQEQDRTMFGTDVILWNHQDIVRALCSVLVKMSDSPSESVKLIDQKRPYIVATKEQWTWETGIFPKGFTEDKLHHQGIPELGESLVFLDDFGAGADGRAWRACTLGTWHGCVVKFAETEETLQRELQNWEALYGKESARIVVLCSEKALLMPYLRPVNFENITEAHAVKSLIEQVSKQGYMHNDLRRRHVGFPSPPPKKQRSGNASDETTEAVPLMFDLVQLVPSDDPSEAKRKMLAKLDFSGG